jgi:hypothetical protein
MIRCLEHAGPSASAIAHKGAELLARFENLAASVLVHPTSWFAAVGPVVEEFVHEMCDPLPEIADKAARTRVIVGMRQLVLSPVPHLRAVGASNWTSNADFVDAVAASCNVWPITSARPVHSYRNASCCDGVNAFSLWDSVGAYVIQLLSGRSTVTAPAPLFKGGPYNWIAAIWNCAVMEPLLPKQPLSVSPGPSASAASKGKAAKGGARLFWVSPGEGGYMALHKVLYLSLPWAHQLWHQGYRHASDLDKGGHFNGLAPRRQTR